MTSPSSCGFVKPNLTATGYDVIPAVDGVEALKAAAINAPDIVLLDLGLPDMDGKDVITELRRWPKVPIVVLSPRDRETETIAALDLGADDYVNKPFGMGELMARIRSALRHASNYAGGASRIVSGDLTIDIAAHIVTRNGTPVRLTPKEFERLAILTRNAGRIMTHRQILTAVWGPALADDVQYLRVFTGQLRQNLRVDIDSADLIQTETGIGYRIAQVSE